MTTHHRSWAAAIMLSALACLLVAIQLLAVSASQEAATPPRRPKQVYQVACSTCHGADGKGAPQSRVGFALPLPDFTDCNFATREPDSDWLAVIHDGGPARAFDPLMPAFAEALSEVDMRKALAHVRSFCADTAWPRGDLNLPRPLVTEKAFLEDEAVFSSSVATEGETSVSNKLVYEKRIGARNQVEIVVPFGFRETDAGVAHGIGDVAIGFKRALFHSLESGTIFSVTGEAVLPTGDEQDEFGKGYGIFEPFVTFGQLLPSDSFVQFQGGIELPTGEDAAKEAFWRTTVGKTISQRRFGRAWSPMIEVIGFKELEEGQKVNWDVVPQLQVSLSTRQHILANVGVRIPVNERDGRGTQVLFYVLWDWFDGGLFGGW
ncbi:MAG: cytochrome c [Acidobacteria bacterium]|nr:MAG: cytochrome c [Acidobacteriota bacterium]